MLLATFGCGDVGKFEPAEIEFALLLPRAPRLDPPDGELSCGGVLTVQIRMVPSAPPATSSKVSTARAPALLIGEEGPSESGEVRQAI